MFRGVKGKRPVLETKQRKHYQEEIVVNCELC